MLKGTSLITRSRGNGHRSVRHIYIFSAFKSMPSDSRDRALSIVKTKGPVLPGHINKELNVNVLFASAMLSELVDSKLIRLSHAKIGGSPVYYAPGQEPRLGQALYNYLNEKDKQTFNLLKQSGILRDSEQTPLVRVSLRQLKDFAFPLEVTLDDQKEIFWKWHLMIDSEAEALIKTALGVDKKEADDKRKKEEAKKAEQKAIRIQDPQPEELKTISDFMKEQEIVDEPKLDLTKPEPARPKRGRKPKEQVLDVDWQDRIRKYFKDAEIALVEQIAAKKGDFEGLIEVPSSVGTIRYYCRAKKKSKLSQDDLAAAYAMGQLKGYPILLLTNGDLGKDAQQALPSFRNLVIKKI